MAGAALSLLGSSQEMSQTVFTDAQRLKSSCKIAIVSNVTFYDVSFFFFSLCMRACVRVCVQKPKSEKFTIRIVIYSPFYQD